MVGGFVVTDRMLEMFKRAAGRRGRDEDERQRGRARATWSAAVCFILALKGLCLAAHRRRGNLIGAAGTVLAVGVTLLTRDARHLPWILAGIVDRRRRSACTRRAPVQMTAMPQMVALFNGVGGGAAALVALRELHDRDRPTSRPGQHAVDRDRVHGDRRRRLLRRLDDHLRQAAGADHRPPGDFPGLPSSRGLLLVDRSSSAVCLAAGIESEGRAGAGRRCWRCCSACCSCCRSAAPTCRS